MSMTGTAISSASKVVVACLDGERRKGYVFNFSALRDSFRLFPEANSPQSAGTDLQIRDVKAIFLWEISPAIPSAKMSMSRWTALTGESSR